MMNIIFFVTMYPVLFLFYFVYKIQYRPNDNYLFAVSMKKEWLEEKAVQDIMISFKKQMNVSLLNFNGVTSSKPTLQTRIHSI